MNSSQRCFRSISPGGGGVSQARGIFILWISWAQEPKLGMLPWLSPFLVLHTSVFKVQPVKQNHQPHPCKCVRNANPEERPPQTPTHNAFSISTRSALKDKMLGSHYLSLCFRPFNPNKMLTLFLLVLPMKYHIERLTPIPHGSV